MKLHLWGTDFRRSTPELRAGLFVPVERRDELLRELLGLGFEDIVYTHTCNRVEFYTTVSNYFADSRPLWLKLLRHLGLGDDDYFRGYHLEGKSAVRHLMRVACSLESMVVGEPQVLGQLKDALATVRGAGIPVRPAMERCFRLAFETAKRVRTETALGEKPISVASLGLQIARDYEPRFPFRRAVVVGRGDISRTVVQWLRSNKPACPILWVNRTPAALESLPESRGTEIRGLFDFLLDPPDFSHLFTATASLEPVFQSAFFGRLTGDTKLVVDFAEPPDVERTEEALQSAQVIRLEGLVDKARANAAARAVAALQAEGIIEEGLREFCLEQKQAPLMKDFSTIEPEVLADLGHALESLGNRFSSDERTAIHKWAQRLLKKNLHRSREHLRSVLSKVTEPDSPML